MATVGDRIKDFRIRAGLSQTELAAHIGVSKQTLYKYENNIVTNIPSDKIEVLALALNVQPSDIMGWIENKNVELVVTGPEREIILRYRQADELTKQMIDRILGIEDSKKDIDIA